jgi:hypothetical protein
MRRTIYTAIFGDYDDLKEPLNPTFVEGWDMVCFTDQNLHSENWKIIHVPATFGPIKTARYYKIMFQDHIESEFSMWIDGTFFINTNLNEWWSKRFLPPFTTIRHPFDRCIYTDALSCMRGKKDNPDVISDQIKFYKRVGLPSENGLIASGILMRQNTSEVRRLCQTWWEQVLTKSCRDQIAFGYAQWRHPDVHQSIGWNYTKEKEFIHIPHKNKGIWRDVKRNEIISRYAAKKR